MTVTVADTFRSGTGFTIERGSADRVTVSKTPAGASEVVATAHMFVARSVPHHELELAFVEAANRERWVECYAVTSSVRLLSRVERRLRLTVETASTGDWCELRQARPKGGTWANLFKANVVELDAGAGIAVAEELRRAGAARVGTGRDLLGDSGQRQTFLCVDFPRENLFAPIVAFLLTRAVPLLRARGELR